MAAPIIFKGNNAKLLKENLEFTNAQFKTGTFSAANNQVSAANVTGLNLSGFRAAAIEISIDIQATADLFAKFRLEAIQKNGTWQLSQEYLGDETNINFSITTGGQIQYTSGNEAGFSSSTMKHTASLMEN